MHIHVKTGVKAFQITDLKVGLFACFTHFWNF